MGEQDLSYSHVLGDVGCGDGVRIAQGGLTDFSEGNHMLGINEVTFGGGGTCKAETELIFERYPFSTRDFFIFRLGLRLGHSGVTPKM